jgi:protein-S-isoprenylcysteine O-methyltransferase Ste14
LRLCQGIGLAGAIIVTLNVRSAAIGSGDLPQLIGIFLLWCGMGLRFWSFDTLGRYFTFTVQTSEDQPVVSSGPYRVIRHPGYAGALLSIIGVGFVLNIWASVGLLTVAFTAGLVYASTWKRVRSLAI